MADKGVTKKASDTGEMHPDGVWPPWWRKYLNDWHSAKNAAANDGLEPPDFIDPDWLSEKGADSKEILEAARLRHQEAEDRITTAEGRATRLVQTALSLLTLTLLAGGFTATRLRLQGVWPGYWIGAVVLAASAMGCLILAAVQALGVDRVGYVSPPEPGHAARFESEADQRRNLIYQEVKATYVANWTALKKVNEFLQARAWLTRGATLLLITGLISGTVWIATSAPDETSAPVQSTTTTTAPTTTSAPATTTVVP